MYNYKPLYFFDRFSLGMNIFHFEAVLLSALKPRFQATDLQKFGLIGKALARIWFYCIFDHGLGLWPAPDSRESPKKYNSGHDGALSIRNVALKMIRLKSLEGSKKAYHSIFNRYLLFACNVLTSDHSVFSENKKKSQNILNFCLKDASFCKN
jgi:hypothetical protein